MEFFERTINSKTIYQGRILNLRLDEVQLPNGRTSTREIVEHPGAVAIVALNEKNEVLMVRQYRKAAEEALLEIPAGKLEKGEEADISAERELMEETGYFAKNLQHIVSFYTSPGFSCEFMHLYLARELQKKKLKADDDEYIAIESYPLEEAVKKVFDGKIKDAKTILGLLLVNDILRDSL